MAADAAVQVALSSNGLFPSYSSGLEACSPFFVNHGMAYRRDNVETSFVWIENVVSLGTTSSCFDKTFAPNRSELETMSLFGVEDVNCM